MSGERLTLAGAFGVDVVALARRIVDRQAELNRDDDACAKLAGVKPETWRGWKEGTDVPGVARVPALSAALDAPASWILYGTTTGDVAPVDGGERSTVHARRALEVLTRLAPAVESIEQLAEEIARLNLPIPGGDAMGLAIGKAGGILMSHDAVKTSTSAAL